MTTPRRLPLVCVALLVLGVHARPSDAKASLAPLTITELHFNPSDEQGPDAEFEFIEILNTGDETVDLSGFSLTVAVELTFPAGTLLEPGQ